LLKKLNGHTALAAHHIVVVVGANNCVISLHRNARACLHPGHGVVLAKDHLSAISPHGVDFDLGRVPGQHNGTGHIVDVTGPGYGLAVVATAMRDTAFEVSGVGCLGEDCV